MARLRLSSPGMLLILAVAVAGAGYLLDLFYLGPYLAGQRTAAIRDQAARVESTARWALRAQENSLSALCRAVSDRVGLKGSTDASALAREVRTLGDVDVAWLCAADGRVVRAWSRGGAAIAREVMEKALAAAAGPADGPARDSGLIDLGGETAIFARCDVRGDKAASAPQGTLYLARRVDMDLLRRLSSAISADLTFVRADRLPESVLDDPSRPVGRRSIWPLDNDRLAVAWPAKDAAGKTLGYFRADLSVARINDHAAANRKTVLIILVLFGAVAVLVIVGAGVLLANPITRLLRRVRDLEAGEYPRTEEFTRSLHAEPLALAEKLQQVFQAMTRESKTDELTGLANRRQFDQALRRACLEARRYNRHLSVMVMDIDLFKAVNDTGGHQVGDKLLKVVAGIVVDCCRKADLPARLGGDEFGVLLPETAAAGAAVVAERIRTTVADRAVPVGSAEVRVTLSIGIADLNAGRIRDPRDLVMLADRALYAAKQAGRNRLAQAHDLAQATWGEGTRETHRVKGLREKLGTLDSQFKDLFVRVLQEIVHALELRDPHMANHARKVQHYALVIARQMYLSEPLTKRVELASLLHDIGMLALPDSVVLCPGRLNEQQWQAMQRHPLLAARILEGMEFLESVIPPVRSHHERFDGTGYPDGLAGHAIPLVARIVAVADAFDAMISPRSFRAARSLPEALAELENGSGSQFDPDVVAAFLAEAERLGDRLTEIPLPSSGSTSMDGLEDGVVAEETPVA